MNSTIKVAGLMALASAAATISSFAEIKEDARKIHESTKDSIVGIKALLKIDISVKGQPAGNQETQIWGNGTVIGDGLLLTSYRSLVPDVMASIGGGGRKVPEGLSVKTNLTEVKLVNVSGEEFDAKLILHDEDLDLAFLALDPKGDTFGDWNVKAVDISKDREVQLLDDIVVLSRNGASMRFQSAVGLGVISTIVKRPRRLYGATGIGPGRPVFASDGGFLGMVTMRKPSGASKAAVPVVLPAKYAQKLVAQASGKQAELKNAPAEKEGEEKKEGDTKEEKKEGDAKEEKKDEGEAKKEEPKEAKKE